MPGPPEGLFGDLNVQREEGNCWLEHGHVSSMPPSIDGSGSTAQKPGERRPAQNWLLLACVYAQSLPWLGDTCKVALRWASGIVSSKCI